MSGSVANSVSGGGVAGGGSGTGTATSGNTIPLGSSSSGGNPSSGRGDRGPSDKSNSGSSSAGNRAAGSNLAPLGDVGPMPMELSESAPLVGSGTGGGLDRVDNARNDNGRHSSSKKSRMDIKHLLPDVPEKVAKSAHSKYVDPHSSDHVIAMTQLKETIATLQRKIKQKDSIILEKEKEVSHRIYRVCPRV